MYFYVVELWVWGCVEVYDGEGRVWEGLGSAVGMADMVLMQSKGGEVGERGMLLAVMHKLQQGHGR